MIRASILRLLQFGTPDNFGGNITSMLQQSNYIHTCSRRILACGQHLFVLRILIAPRKLLEVCISSRYGAKKVLYIAVQQVELGLFSYHPLHD